jgi:DNA (cytosine-5)-methyltransferase 1
MKVPSYFLSLFAGIGGFDLAAYWAGLRFDGHYFSEVESYAVSVFQKRFPEAIALGNVRRIDYDKLPKGDWIVAGGFPCQPHSVAGKRQASKDERDLWSECARMLRELRPKIALFENVPGLLISDWGRFFNGVLSDISESGYDAKWTSLRASSVGAFHKRERIWLVAYPASNRLQTGKVFKETGRKKNKKEYRKKTFFQFDFTRIGYSELRVADKSIICGEDYGIPGKLDRLKCLGNAIVPQCAEVIFMLPVFDKWRTGGGS